MLSLVSKDGGEFLSLGVWATRGFDVERIKSLSTPRDIQVHRVLGETYKVSIFSSGVGGEKGSERKSIASSSGAKQKLDREQIEQDTVADEDNDLKLASELDLAQLWVGNAVPQLVGFVCDVC